MWTRESLLAHLTTGASVEFLLFWGHTPRVPGAIDKSCLSQWFERPFTDGGATYRTAEHFMMAEKARLFGDRDALGQILAAPTPADAKALGREVRGYDDARWSSARFDAVVRGNLAKFGQHADLRGFLVGTGGQVLVEASPHDRIWGIGLDAGKPEARDVSRWKGLNLLGFALMEVRERLRAA